MSETEAKKEETEAPKAEAAPAPLTFNFGSAADPPATGFGGTGFQFGSFAAAPPPAAPAANDDDDAPAVEEENQTRFEPVVHLDEVEKVTGEEDEDILYEVKAKVYRFQGEWKERGVGVCKLLQHKETKKCRLLMRRNKTLKICMNQSVQHNVSLKEHAGNEKAWVWSAMDFADGENKEEMLAIRFGSVEKAQEFKKSYEEAQAKLEPQSDTPAKDESEEITKGLAETKVEDDTDPDEEKKEEA